MSDENLQPVFQIQRVYLKDLSLEQPNSPAIFLEQQAPAIEVSVDVGSEKLADGVFESTVTVTVTAKKRVFSKHAISLQISSTHCWVSVALTLCTHICVPTLRMRSHVQASHQFTCLKSILKRSMRSVCKWLLNKQNWQKAAIQKRRQLSNNFSIPIWSDLMMSVGQFGCESSPCFV